MYRYSLIYFNPHHPRGWRHDGRMRWELPIKDFNPHHPRGWRPVAVVEPGGGINFNPHHPRGWRRVPAHQQWLLPFISIHTTLAGGDPLDLPPLRPKSNFNPHHPRGWRLCGYQIIASVKNFNPHHPRGWRRSFYYDIIVNNQISIHTTLAGGDRVYFP